MKPKQKEKLFNFLIKLTGGIVLTIMLIYSDWFLQWYNNQIPFIFYVENYRTLTNIGTTFLLIGWYVVAIIVLSAFLQNYKHPGIKIIGIVLVILSISGCCLNIFKPQDLPIIVDTVEINSETYFLVEDTNFLDSHTFHDLYKCSNASFECESVYGTMYGNPQLKLLVDNNEVHIVKYSQAGDAWLEFTYATPPRYYSDFIQWNGDVYYLAYSHIPGEKISMYMLYKCELDNTDCIRLPFQYQSNGYISRLRIDEISNEIKIYS